PMLGKHMLHRRPVRDVRLNEDHSCIVQRLLDAEQTAGIRQLVDDDEAIRSVGEGVMNQVRADETCPAGYEKRSRQTAAPSGYCNASFSSLVNDSTVVPPRFHAPSVSKRKSPIRRPHGAMTRPIARKSPRSACS